MADAANQSGTVSRIGLVVVVLAALLWSALSFVPPGPLHADEAVQWSLAKELSEGTPYSAHQDKFHGPTLATVLLSRGSWRCVKLAVANPASCQAA